MTRRPALALRLLACALLTTPCARAVDGFDIGMSASGRPIDAIAVEATHRDARTVVLVGGLHGEDADTTAVRAAAAAYGKRRDRPVRLLAVPLANPDASALVFPPQGVAYRQQAESHVLWRWLGALAPDLVLVSAEEDSGLAAALGSQAVADMGRIPARHWYGTGDWLQGLGPLPKSDAHEELDRRRARSPRQLATELGARYGRDFDQPWYIGAIALVARAKLGDLNDVRQLVEPWVNGSKDSLARPNSLVMAGHVVFTELARRAPDPRYVAAVRKVADMGFDAEGGMRESMPYHEQFSDSVFMGTAIVAQAGALTGERRYFDMADRHLRFMERLDLRPDGLYRHEPTTDMAWARGNGFAALGLALALSELPADHPGHAHALGAYQRLMSALLRRQTRDGLWRNVVDHPGTYAEFSSTAMIGFALQRGLARGWIHGRLWREATDRAWVAVNSRSSSSGRFIDVCESTAKMKAPEDYLHRTALLGEDPRGGAMAMLFATERMEAIGR